MAALPEVKARELVMRLTSQGKTLQQVTAEVNKEFAEYGADYKWPTIQDWRAEELRDAARRADDAADLALARQLEVIRESMGVIADQVTSGDLNAIDRQIKLLDREAKLLGLDAPTKFEGGMPVVVTINGIEPDTDGWQGSD